MSSEEYKAKAADTLESVAHWIKTSAFDYEIKDLNQIFNEVIEDYKQYKLNKSK